MSVLVLGAEGILGAAVLRAIPGAAGTTRRRFAELQARPRGHSGTWLITGVDITNRYELERALALGFAETRPEARTANAPNDAPDGAPDSAPNVVINCAGVVKSECDKHPASYVRAVNADAPHVLAEWAKIIGCRVIHVSTDCVFDGEGRTGPARKETDDPDATDLYGKSKAEGELTTYDHCLTIRTSFIGPDPLRGRGLWEWLKASDPRAIVGYTRMLWSGLSDDELALIISDIVRPSGLLRDPATLKGLYHVSGPAISKADLLDTLLDARGREIEARTGTRWDPVCVRRADEPVIDRTLDDARFRALTEYQPPTWRAMARALADRAGKTS